MVNLKPYQVLGQCNFSYSMNSLAFINTELHLPAKCQLPNFICHCTDFVHHGSSRQSLWHQSQEQEESLLCDLQCCWCPSAWQQVAELLQCCSGKEQCEHHVRGEESMAQQRGHP